MPAENARGNSRCWRHLVNLHSWGSVLLLCIIFAGAGCGSGFKSTVESPLQADLAGVVDLDDKAVNPFEANGGQPMVLLFVSPDCPISNRYAPAVRRLFQEFQPHGIKFWLVYPDPETSIAAIKEHTRQFGYPMEVLRDRKHELVERAEVRVTPSVAVFLSDHGLGYCGRIDNRYQELGKERPEATQHDLQEVLDAISRGDQVTVRKTRAVGCYIPSLR